MQKFLMVFIAFALAPFAWPLPAAPQIAVVPGSSVRGAELFREKKCNTCHTFNGVPQAKTPILLATALWNHIPDMWRAQNLRNLWPVLDSAETADLFSYFFALAYSNAPGNALRGRAVFEEKSCTRCHDTEPRIYDRGHSNGPPLSTWSEVDDPLAWAERMWNHSSKVYTELSINAVPWPQFSTKDMADLLTYLRMAPESRSHSAVFQLADSEKGRIIFERACESCHSFGDRSALGKVDLLKRPGPTALMDYSTMMWNHAPLMQQRAGKDFPILSPGDMSNLVAYLFAQWYASGEGNIARGEQIFATKNCAYCHEQRRSEIGAPNLATVTERYSAITISAAVWRHGPAMFELMSQHQLDWPKFKGSEMADLIAFLNNRLVTRMVRPQK